MTSERVHDVLVIEELPLGWDGDRLDRIVSQACDCPRSVAAELVKAGEVSLDGVVVQQRSRRCAGGQRLEIAHVPDVNKVELPKPQPEIDIPIIHVDEHIIIVNKPVGLVVHPGSGQPDGTMVNGLLAVHPEIEGVGEPIRPGIVHRLDKPTSGLLVVARTQMAYEALVRDMSTHVVVRRYLALVWGRMGDERGIIDAPIGRSRRNPTAMAIVTSGRPARTHYEVIGRHDDPETTALSCQLETGRTHQIRVHLKAMGHSVVGDDRYDGVKVGLGEPRLQLHAAQLAFTHPDTGEAMGFTSPAPADLHERLHSSIPDDESGIR